MSYVRLYNKVLKCLKTFFPKIVKRPVLFFSYQ